MTLIVAWIGVDTHGPSSAYIAGDSRVKWPNNKYFDFGKKVFSSSVYPEIFGYAGDVLFPSIVLSQIIDMIDSGVLFSNILSCDQKNKLVREKLTHSFSKYPKIIGSNIIDIVHISRDTVFKNYPDYHCFHLKWSLKNSWSFNKIQIPKTSDIVLLLGSGGAEFTDNYNNKYQKGENRGTTRNVFHCFCDTLFNIKNSACGGPPQLVGIFRKPLSNPINFGIIHNNKRYFLGAEVPPTVDFNNIKWRNEKFELCDGNTMKRLNNANRQPNDFRKK